MTDLAVAPGLVIPGEELRETASRSGGPGGQRVNKVSTRVTLRWNPGSSRALGPGRRARLLERLGPRLSRGGDLIVHASRHRSRGRNRELARERLAERVREALRVEPPRHPSLPTRASRLRRLEAKRRRAGLKRGRGRRGAAED